MAVSGPTLFARYAYPPNELGYCGPGDFAVLLGGGSVEADQEIARHARLFDGAWPYLEIIAAAAQIENPLDSRVVEAYWIGNELLDNVDPGLMVSELQSRFVGQSGATWVSGVPHHSFHVFAVYPWVRLLRRSSAADDVALTVLERCRIRWGEVLAVEGERVRVRFRPLVRGDDGLAFGSPREQTALWATGDRSLLTAGMGGLASQLTPVRIGDQVAMHWDWVCDVLDPAQVAELEYRSGEQLARTNAALRMAHTRR